MVFMESANSHEFNIYPPWAPLCIPADQQWITGEFSRAVHYWLDSSSRFSRHKLAQVRGNFCTAHNSKVYACQ